MTELGLVYAGDPLAFHGWGRERQVRALAWARARHAEAVDTVSTAAPVRSQLRRLLRPLVEDLARVLLGARRG